MSTPDAGALPPMNPSAPPETQTTMDAVTNSQVEDFGCILGNCGIIDHAAHEDPEEFDNYRTYEGMRTALSQLNERHAEEVRHLKWQIDRLRALAAATEEKEPTFKEVYAKELHAECLRLTVEVKFFESKLTESERENRELKKQATKLAQEAEDFHAHTVDRGWVKADDDSEGVANLKAAIDTARNGGAT